MLTSRHNDDEEPGTRLRLLQFHDVMGRRSAGPAPFDPRALAECKRCMSLPGCARGICEDYRAAAGIDLAHDAEDGDDRIACPLLVLWGEHGAMHRLHDVLGAWRPMAGEVRGRALPAGHFLPEECPDATLDALEGFFSG
jgi:haloacetate dehalogenase